MFAFVTIVEPQFDSLNAARKGALKSHIFGAPKAGDRWNVPVLWHPFVVVNPEGVNNLRHVHFHSQA